MLEKMLKRLEESPNPDLSNILFASPVVGSPIALDSHLFIGVWKKQ